jgi:hypothetical protein
LPAIRSADPALGLDPRVHIDLAEVRTEEGKLRVFVVVDRTNKFAFVRLVESAGKMAAALFLRDLILAVPYRIHTVLTDNRIQFTNRAHDQYAFTHIFDRVCDEPYSGCAAAPSGDRKAMASSIA